MGQEVFSADIISYNNYNVIEQSSWSTILPVMTVSEPSRGAVLEAPTNSSPRMNASVMPVLVSPGVVGVVGASSGGVFESNLIIPLYLVIFLLAVVGNSMVLITLAQNKRMRTVTNVYLLNLAVSDLLLGVFCMPFTLVGQVLRNFVFGDIMCKLIPYFQAVSVSVGVWTLVAISLERCFAICRPLKSRRWQTQCHAYKMIVVVWLGSLFWNLPILVVSRRQAMRQGKHKCREVWPSASGERAYNLFLDVVLLLIPLAIMTLAYSLIVSKLWKGLRREIRHHSSCRRQQEHTGNMATTNDDAGGGGDGSGDGSPGHVTIALTSSRHSSATGSNASASNTNATMQCGSRRKPSSVKLWLIKGMVQVRLPNSSRTGTVNSRCSLVKSRSSLLNRPSPLPETSRLIVTASPTGPLLATSNPDLIAEAHSTGDGDQQEVAASNQYSFSRQAIRSNYMDKSIEAKKKVIRMLFVIIAEFFVCWAPLHVLNTWYLFSPEAVYKHVGSTGVSLVQLLAYVSSCCNPITYCFMNRKFRQAFIGVFHCYSGSSSHCGGCLDLGGPGRSAAHPRGCRDVGTPGGNINSDLSGNDSTMFVRRVTGMPRSEVLVLEGEDRV